MPGRVQCFLSALSLGAQSGFHAVRYHSPLVEPDVRVFPPTCVRLCAPGNSLPGITPVRWPTRYRMVALVTQADPNHGDGGESVWDRTGSKAHPAWSSSTCSASRDHQSRSTDRATKWLVTFR